MFYEPAIRAGDRFVGEESGIIPRDNSRVIASQDRHQMVSELGTAIRVRSTFHTRTCKIRRIADRSTVPVDNRCMEYTENTEIRNIRVQGELIL